VTINSNFSEVDQLELFSRVLFPKLIFLLVDFFLGYNKALIAILYFLLNIWDRTLSYPPSFG